MLQTNAGSCNRMLLQRMLKAHQRLRLQLLALQTWKLNNGCDCCANECWKLINGCNCWMLQTNAESSTTAAIAGCCKRMLLQRMLEAHQRLQLLCAANECWKLNHGCNCWMLQTNAESSSTAAIAGCCKRMLKAEPRLRLLMLPPNAKSSTTAAIAGCCKRMCCNECWKLINGCDCWMLQTNAES
jgi:hypothetical protein